jgi:hypothetical protein
MKRYRLIPIAVLAVVSGCVRKIAQAPSPQTNLAVDNSYLDLEPGSRLGVVLPILKNGDTRIAVQSQQTTGNTIELSAGNLLGYERSVYFVEGRSHGQVRLRFIAAQMTRGGKTQDLSAEPALPFALPGQSQHVRLIYYIRASQSDHNMAIAGAKNMDALVAFTKRFEENPKVCGSVRDVFCSWVPPGVAVRPE